MPTQLDLHRHLDGLYEAARAFVSYAGRAGVDAAVPTCPGWSVLDLIAHQGMVHRWAAALVRGEEPPEADVDGYADAGKASADPLGWLAEGAERLAEALRAAPDDLSAPVFLPDAPPPRRFWARRQCHETTMHGLDALAASLGRAPEPSESWIDAELAGDGIDELLGGFLTRPGSRLRCDVPSLLVVRPDDLADWWEVRLGPRPATTTRHSGGGLPAEDPEWELTGGAVELYLRLWNRTRPPPGWRSLTAVGWS